MYIRAISLWGILIGAGTILGCATSTSNIDSTATLEVVNHTVETLEIFRDGALLGRIDSGNRQRIRQVQTGPANFTAESLNGEKREARNANLAVGDVLEWILAPEDQERRIEAPTGLGVIQIDNQSGHDLLLSLDQENLGTILAGDTRRLRDVPTGEHRLTAIPMERGTHIHKKFVVTKEQTSLWTVEPFRTTLKVINGSSQSIFLKTAKGAEQILLRGEEQHYGGIAPGTHTLQVRYSLTNAREMRTFHIAEDTPVEWVVGSMTSGIQVHNDTAQPMRIVMDEVEWGTIPSGETHLFKPVDQGPHALKALGTTDDLQFHTDTTLGPGQVRLWRIWDGLSTARIQNLSSERIRAWLGDREVGEINPGEHVLVSGLPTGQVEGRAVGYTSKKTYTRMLSLRPTTTVQWTVEQTGASLRVQNMTSAGVNLFVDAHSVAAIPSGATVILDGLSPGESLLEARDPASDGLVRGRILLREGMEETWVIQKKIATLKVINNTDEGLRTSSKLGGDVIPSKLDKTFTISAVPQLIHLKGVRTGLDYQRFVESQEGEAINWVVEELRGGLHVFNKRREPIEIHFPQGLHATVDAREDVLIHPVPVGSWAITARGLQSGVVMETYAHIDPIRPYPVEIGYKPSGLHVENNCKETVDLFIDGVLYGYLEPGQDATFGPMPFRSHDALVFFKTGSSTITSDGLDNLRSLADSLGNRSSSQIELHGHTDSVGSDENNITLSVARAEAVHRELASADIPVTLFVLHPHGEKTPAATNLTQKGRATNRRVELVAKMDGRQHVATAVARQTGHQRSLQFHSREGVIDEWPLSQTKAVVRITNQRQNGIEINAQQKQNVELASGHSQLFPLSAGHTSIYAREGQHSMTTLLTTLPDQMVDIDIHATTGAMVIDNPNENELSLELDHINVGIVPPHSRRILVDLPLGAATLKASNTSGSTSWILRTQVISGAILYWRVLPNRAL